MNGQRPPVVATANILTIGTVLAAATLAAAFVSGLLGAAWLDSALSTTGLVALLITPVAGLVATFFEMRPVQPRAAQWALVVLGVLAASTLVAVLTR